MRIDTKEIEQIRTAIEDAVAGKTHVCMIPDLAQRVLDLIIATTPFASRAEVETYLKGKGFVPNSKYISQFNHPNHTGWVDIEVDCDKPMFRFASITVPLSALTPALLDKILEAK